MKTHISRLALGVALALLGSIPALRADEFNWDGANATLEQLLQYVKAETGKRFVYDPAVFKGADGKSGEKRVTIMAPDFRKENLLPLLEAVLEMQGLGLAASGDEKGEIFKVVPAANLKSQPLPVYTQDDLKDMPNTDRLVTQVLTLKHIDPSQVGPILNDLMHIPTGSIRPIPNSNVVVLTEYASNMKRLAKIIEVMDRENAPPQVKLFPLYHATASELAPRLNSLLNGLNSTRRSVAGGGPQLSASVLEDTRTNSLIVMGFPSDLETAKGLIDQLDKDLGEDQNTIQFFPLQHRNAKELAEIIKAMYTEQQDAVRQATPGTLGRPLTQTLTPPGQPGLPNPPQAAAGPSTAGDPEHASGLLPRIVADEDTNALIAIGPPRSFRELKNTIDRLDIRRPQVFIEATIMEVGEQGTRNLGLQLASVEQPNDRSVLFGGSNFGFTTPDASDPTSSTINPAQGLVAGVFKDSTRRIPAILRALETTNDADVIATPGLMTNDNKKASLTLSDQQPTTTTQTGTATTNTTFNQFVNADTKLEITPHISIERREDGSGAPYLRLEITQTLEKFVGASTSAGVPPPKESRTTTTHVTIPDGATVVISAFSRKDRRVTVSKIPFIGDIPLIGYFFRNTSTVDVKTNILLFITPRIMSTPEEIEAFDRSLQGTAPGERQKALREKYFGPYEDRSDLVPDWLKRKFKSEPKKPEEKEEEAPAPPPEPEPAGTP